MNYNWNWRIFWQQSPNGVETYLDLLLSGLQWTIFVAICSWVIALALGSFIGVMRTTQSRFWSVFGQAYVEIFRNIPLLVQMFLWYFVVPELLPNVIGTWIKQVPDSSAYTAILCLGLFTSARIAEQVRAGIQSLPSGQRMASLALGLTSQQAYRHILLPIAYRIMLPPLTSEFLNNFKNTSVTFAIGVMELMAQTRSMSEFSFQVFEALTAATILYLAINLVVVMLARLLERKFAVPGFMTAH